MECPRCKEKLNRDTRFCPSCGLVVEDLVEELLKQEEPMENEVPALEDPKETTAVIDKEPSEVSLPEDESEGDEESEGADAGDDATEDAGAADHAPEDAGAEGEGPEDAMDVDAANEAGRESEESQKEEPGVSKDRFAEDVPKSEMPEGIGGLDEPEPGNGRPSDGWRTTKQGEGKSVNAPSQPPQEDVGASKDSADPNASIWSQIKSFVASHKTAVLFVIALLLALLAVGIVLKVLDAQRVRLEAESQAAYAQSLSTARPIAVGLEIDNYSEEHMTPIPLRVTGTSVGGESVDEVLLVTPQAPELMLVPGSYSVRLEGCPVSDDGALFNGSIDTFALEVPVEQQDHEDNAKSVVDKPQKPLVFVFAPVAPQNIRESDVDAARAWMKEVGFPKADAYADAVANRRNEAMERIEQEQTAREEEGLKTVEDTTKQIEKQIADNRKKKQQQQNGQSTNQQNGSGSGYDNGYGEYGNEADTYNNWLGYDQYGNAYDNTYGNTYDWSNPWGY